MIRRCRFDETFEGDLDLISFRYDDKSVDFEKTICDFFIWVGLIDAAILLFFFDLFFV